MTTRFPDGGAFVSSDNAECRYNPDDSSPARVVPPYGTYVIVGEERGDWVHIEYCGKSAWARQSMLSTVQPEPRFDISPYLFGDRRAVISNPSPNSAVEYGPRGGRFTRTNRGYKRYF
ncbi:MAG: hypothetical protein KDE32_05120 [Novosphingobium sp.]|nr:hypothetical protein [Novosphingobium sp.]